MTTPDWPTCATAHCTGIRAGHYDHCLAHLHPEHLNEVLQSVKPGSDLDARGTTISDELLAKLTDAVDAKFGDVDFTNAVFTARSGFDNAELGRAVFVNAKFDAMEAMGPLQARDFILDRATFDSWLWIEESSYRMSCVGTNFGGGVSLRVLVGLIDLTNVVLGAKSTVALGNRGGVSYAWLRDWSAMWEDAGLAEEARGPELISLRETDVSNLVLVNIELRWCLFAGAHRLDQLRIEGQLRFRAPHGRWRTRRQMLAEEYAVRHHWIRHPFTNDEVRISEERVAALYRSLRKAFEDSKNEAGAGDFYYGEMEMRRRALTTRRAEKLILWGYWLLSGYGQRAWRAVACLVALVAIVCMVLFVWGLPGGLWCGVGRALTRRCGSAWEPWCFGRRDRR